ncbi:MAG TPA: coenzyme F420 biosynthesis-associated protein, partial [Propionibacteriaceae bacterium]|nr:coenzyme F420 biosynthesis-associated protein [Propionibacteriaceae bacterium]
WQRFLGRLLGMELKMAQYREGAKFVRAVIDTVGLESFNRVFSAAEFLPTRAEIADPSAWVARVHP